MNNFKAIAFKASLMTLAAGIGLGATGSAFAVTPKKPDQWSLHSLWAKPILRDAAVGTVIGVGAGMLTHRTSVGKGALAGALTGAGTGAVSQSKYLKGKPLVRNTLEGAVIGTGTSYATDSSRMKGALVGAGAGAGYHYVKKMVDTRH